MTRTLLHAFCLLLLGLALWPQGSSTQAAPRRIVCDRTPAPQQAPAIDMAPTARLAAAGNAAHGGRALPVAVIFPRAPDPYRAAFLSVVGGVRESLGERAEVLEVSTSETSKDIGARIAAHESDTVVLLGSYGLEVARGLDRKIDRVVGAVAASPDQLPQGARGISMVPSPRSLFQKLRELAPAVKNIAVVHSGGDENDWLMARAAREAKTLGYGFSALRRDTLSDAAKAYRELLETQMHAPTDALWLPPGSPYVKEKPVMEMIVSRAWDRNIVVFSSSGSHVQRGTLFALVPDNAEMGRALGRMAAAPPVDGSGLQLLEQLDTAINIRTANHLGLELDSGDPRFDLVFPNR